MLIIGIDLSMTGTGLVSLIDGKLDKTQLIKTELEGKGLVDRMSRIEKILTEITTFTDQYYKDGAQPENLIVIEGYSFASRSGQAFSIGELGGIIRYWVATNVKSTKFLSVLEIPPTQLKKFITGKGNCDKNLILKEIYKNFNVDFDDDNIADAFGLAYMAWCYYNMKNHTDKKLKLNAGQVKMMKEFMVAETNKVIDKAMKEKKK